MVLSSLLFLVRKQDTFLQIHVQEDGQLILDSPIDSNTADAYRIFWETDAGSLQGPQEAGYYCTSQIQQSIGWQPREQNGTLFSSATVRAFLFEVSSYAPMEPQAFRKVASAELTLSYDTDTNLILPALPRHFGNPIKADSDTNWQEIYPLYQQKSEVANYIILRYRTGNTIRPGDSICWETNAAPFSKATHSFLPPFSPAAEVSNKRILKNTDTTCFNLHGFDGFFFTNEKNSSENQYELHLSAFVISGGQERYQAVFCMEIEQKTA